MNMRFAWFSVDGSAGLLKFLGRKTLELFHMSAYSTAFFFSIAARELLGGASACCRIPPQFCQSWH
jgi:hypothetical protein